MERLAIDGGTPVRKGKEKVPFHALELGAEEIEAAAAVIRSGNIVGNGPVAREFQKRIVQVTGSRHAFFTASATAAFHVGVLSADLTPGDEVILPSFGFVSVANVLVMSGARVVFADIEDQTLNLDLAAVEKAVTPKTRAVVPVHYAGQSCDMEALQDLAKKRRFEVWEDAAQSIGVSFKGRTLGSWGRFGFFSFHHTKNVSTGEGGALVTSDDALARRAEIVLEKGTDRSAFLRGEVDKYTWIDKGSSFVQSDILAGIGLAQLAKLDRVTARRREIATIYLDGLAGVAGVRLPQLRAGTEPNWHIFWVLVDPARRDRFLKALAAEGVAATSHFVPLHDSPFARRHLAPVRPLPVTERAAASIVRLPIHTRISDADARDVVAAVRKVAASL